MTFNISNFAKQVITLLPDEEKSCQEAVDLISEATTEDNADKIATKIFEQIGNEKGLSKIALIFSRTSPESPNFPVIIKIKNACLERLIPDYQKKHPGEKIRVALEKKEVGALATLFLQDGQGGAVANNLETLGLIDLPDDERLKLAELIVLLGGAKELAYKFVQFRLLVLPLAERRKLCELIVMHGGASELACNFKKCGLESLPDEERLKLAQLIALHGGAWGLGHKFQDFGLENLPDDERIKLAEWIVMHGHAPELITNFENFKLNDPALAEKRLKLCELIASHGGARNLASRFYKFGLKDISVEERLKLARLIASHGEGAALAWNLKDIIPENLQDEEQFELCKLIASHGGGEALIALFEKFRLGNFPANERLQLCKLIVSNGKGAAVAINFQKFKLDDPSLIDNRLKLCELITSQGDWSPLAVAKHFDKFKLDPLLVDKRLQLCELIVKHGGAEGIINDFEKFGFDDPAFESERLKLAELIVSGGGALGLPHHFNKFRLGDIPIERRLQLCELIVLHGGGSALIYNISRFNLGDLSIDRRLELCRLIASHKGGEILPLNFQGFGLKDPPLIKERLELYKLIALNGGGKALAHIFGSFWLDVEEAVALAQLLCRSRSHEDVLEARHISRLNVEQQVYLEAWRPPYLGGRNLDCWLAKEVFTDEFSELLPVLQRDDKQPIQEALSTLKGFIEHYYNFDVFLPLIEQIEKTKAEYQPTLVDWVAYAAGVLFEPGTRFKNKAIETSGMINFLFEHKKPEDRYIFMRLLSNMAKEGAPLPNAEGLPSNQYFKVFSPLLLHPLKQLGLDKDTYQSLNEEIAKKDFRQFKNFDPLIQFFQCMTIQVPLDEKEINFLTRKALEWLKSMPDGPLKTAAQRIRFKNGLRNFTALSSIFNVFKKAEYSDVLTGIREDYVNFFAERFKDKFEIVELEDVNRKYDETFGTSRDPMALFTYLGSIEKLGEGDRKLVKEAFTKYVVAVLEGKFPAVRYEYDEAAESHLKQVFQRPEIREGWIAKSAPMKFSLKASEERKAMDYKQFFRTKILDDKHIHPDEVPRLAAFLNGEKTEKMSNLEEPLEKLQDLAIQLIKGEIEVGDFLKAIDEFKHDLPEVFRNDLTALTPQKGGGEYQIEESDDPYDLLLIGTEIKGSCQRIDGSPELNKCLVSYLINGEIKAIAVKEGNKLVARSVMRLLWDPVKGPIILLERVYSNISDEQIDAKILAWAKNKAEQLKVPLVSKEVGEKSTPYKGEVNFLGGGAAPFMYSDAGGGVENGPFNVAGSYLQ